MAQSAARTSDQHYLNCEACGNSERFFEIMAHESHVVDGELNYVHLLDAQVDRYLCAECGHEVKVKIGRKPLYR